MKGEEERREKKELLLTILQTHSPPFCGNNTHTQCWSGEGDKKSSTGFSGPIKLATFSYGADD